MNKLIKYIAIFIVLVQFEHYIGFSQDYVFKNFSVNDGLPSSEVYHCIQDRKGYLWIATDNGVCRYDGYYFVNYDIQNGLINNMVSDLYEDYKGRIWFISLSGKLCYHEDSKIVPYQFNSKLEEAIRGSGLPVKQSFYVDSLDNIYISIGNNGIFKITSSGKISKIEEQKYTGYIYLAKINENKTLTGFLKATSIAGIVEDNLIMKYNINTLFSNVNLLFHVKTNESVSYISYKNSIYKIENKKILKIASFENDIIWFDKDRNGNFWLSIRDHGMMFFKKPEFEKRADIVYFSDKSVTSVLIDNENAYWFTTLSEGVYYVPSNQINNMNLSDFKSVNVLSVGNSPGMFWIGLEKGVLLGINNKDNKIVKKLNIDKWDEVLNIKYHPQYKTLILGTQHFVYSYDNNKLKKIEKQNRITTYNKASKSLSVGHDNYFYSGTNYGIDKFDNGTLISESDQNGTFNQIVYTVLENPDKSLWIGTNNGLWKYKDGNYTNWDVKNKLLSTRITAIYKQNTSLYLGTKGAGLVIMDLQDYSVKSLTKDDGLSGNSISCITGNNSEVWLGTNKGINRVKFLVGNIYQIQKLDASIGLVSNEVNQLLLDSNMLYIATKKGFNYINLNDFEWTTEQPRLHIEKISINSKDTLIANNYQLNYFQNDINFSYVAISYKSNRDILYKYRLFPLEKEWKNTYLTSVNYNSLPPGNYHFEIKARSENGIWSQKSQQIQITIDKPFWKQWWYYLFIILILVVIFYLLIYNKIEKLKYQNKLKSELDNLMKNTVSLAFNDHFLFNSLNSLNHLILSGKKSDSSKLLTKISSYFRAVLHSIKLDFVSLSDEINLIKIYLEIEKQRLKERFSYNFDISTSLNFNELFIPGILLQPFIEASIWSVSLADMDHLNLELNMKREIDNLLISVQINTKFPQVEHSNGNRNLKQKTPQEIVETVERRAKLINEFYDLDMKVKYSNLEDTNNSTFKKLLSITMPINKLLQNKKNGN